MTEGPDRVVGAGAGGLATASALRAEAHSGPITRIGEESHDPDDRPALSKQALVDAGIEFRPGTRVVGVDPAARVVGLADGSEVGYRALVAATGVRVRGTGAVLLVSI